MPIFRILLLLNLAVVSLLAQNAAVKNYSTPTFKIADEIAKDIQLNASIYTTSLFGVYTKSAENILPNQPTDSITLLTIDSIKTKKLLNLKPRFLKLIIPLKDGKNLTLVLKQNERLGANTALLLSSPTPFNPQNEAALHYWGVVENSKSIVAISIFNTEVMGIIAMPYGNINLGKIESSPVYALFNDAILIESNNSICATNTEEQGKTVKIESNQNEVKRSATSTKCVQLYWEVNNDVYIKKGSLTTTYNFIMGIFNQHQLLNYNDGITVSLKQLKIWNSVSPYTGGSLATEWLNSYQSITSTFNGDVATFIRYSTRTGGAAGSIGGLCSNDWGAKKCYAGILSTYRNLPVYSWSVTVITHEQGHIFGSRHTHDCVWNGNNTRIDGCGPAVGYPSGTCTAGPIPPAGTIMSYCYYSPNPGVNLSLGFGPQPDSVIVYTINNANCLSDLPCDKDNTIPIISDGFPTTIFPNPTSGAFTLEIANINFNEININVFNTLGKLIYSTTEEQQAGTNGFFSTVITLIDYPAGVYFVQIRTEKNRTTKKIAITERQ